MVPLPISLSPSNSYRASSPSYSLSISISVQFDSKELPPISKGRQATGLPASQDSPSRPYRRRISIKELQIRNGVESERRKKSRWGNSPAGVKGKKSLGCKDYGPSGLTLDVD
ncbi:hypothetical protein AAHA92_10109 [Salvia divinorum]|uniref:Uncharacterized protein n=1 Tax=Salvia divinorum TaxID=28513 RepID=A0ABD1HWZ3_SALDI